MKRLVIALLAGAPLLAAAQTNPLSVQASTDGAWALSFTTSVLPRGWFTEGPRFTSAKTTLTAEVAALQSACSNAAQSDARLSTTDGSVQLGAVSTPSDKNVTGYFWSYQNWDLTAFRNSYSNHYVCDVLVEVRGCDAARPIALTVTAFDKNGVRTYTDASGVEQPVQFTVTGLSLPAWHDEANDQFDPCPPVEPDCGIGACQSACVQPCAPGQAGKSCREACECTCKIEVNQAYPTCHANDKCLQP